MWGGLSLGLLARGTYNGVLSMSVLASFSSHRPTRRPQNRNRSRRVPLHVEALEGRDVPAVMNLTCYTFALPGATR